LGWRPGPEKVGQKFKNTPTCDISPENSELESNIVFSTKTKTFRILAGFEQLSSSNGWKIMAKKVPATIVAGAGVKGAIGR